MPVAVWQQFCRRRYQGCRRASGKLIIFLICEVRAALPVGRCRKHESPDVSPLHGACERAARFSRGRCLMGKLKTASKRTSTSPPRTVHVHRLEERHQRLPPSPLLGDPCTGGSALTSLSTHTHTALHWRRCPPHLGGRCPVTQPHPHQPVTHTQPDCSLHVAADTLSQPAQDRSWPWLSVSLGKAFPERSLPGHASCRPAGVSESQLLVSLPCALPALWTPCCPLPLWHPGASPVGGRHHPFFASRFNK